MKTIYRYSVFPRGDSHPQFVTMRRGAQIISVSAHHDNAAQGEIAVHAIVDDVQPALMRKVYVIETGKEIPDSQTMFYVGTVRLLNSRYVVHIFVEPE